MADTSDRSSHGDYVPDGGEFAAQRTSWRESLAGDDALRQQAVDLQVAAEQHHYTYQWEWAGVPVIRIPDDVMVLQELFWSYRPERVVETGVARGGSMLLNASLMRMCGLEPACSASTTSSTRTPRPRCRAPAGRWGRAARGRLDLRHGRRGGRATSSTEPSGSMLVLDSNHTHDHVLGELRALAPLLPVGSMVLVADTLVEEFPEGHYEGRPWDRGDNPMTAVRAFLAESDDDVRRARVGPPGAGHRVPRRDPAAPLRPLRAGDRVAAPASAGPTGHGRAPTSSPAR